MDRRLVSLLVSAAVALAGCNTLEGIGKDLSAAGEAISSSAKKDDVKKDETHKDERPAVKR